MIRYKVSAQPAPDLVSKYKEFMREVHIPELMATGCFLKYEFEETEDGGFEASYYLADSGELERYQNEFGDELRADFLKHFPTGVELSREITEI